MRGTRLTIALLATVALTACSSGGSEFERAATVTTTTSSTTTTTVAPTTTLPPNPVITGSFTLIDADVAGTWNACAGTNGYDDFGPGMNVTVRDGEGKIVGVGNTEALTEADRTGIWADDVEFSEGSTVSCVVKFTVEVKPSEFYSVEVGSRGELTYSADELEASGWHVELSLG